MKYEGLTRPHMMLMLPCISGYLYQQTFKNLNDDFSILMTMTILIDLMMIISRFFKAKIRWEERQLLEKLFYVG